MVNYDALKMEAVEEMTGVWEFYPITDIYLEQTLDIIEGFTDVYRVPPNARQISERLGLPIGTVSIILDVLVAREKVRVKYE